MDASHVIFAPFILMMILMVVFMPIMIALWITRRIAKSTKKTIYTIRKA